MKIKKEEISHIANLAKLELSEEEISLYQKDLSSILEYVNSLKEVDTSEVEATSSVSGLMDVFRDDVSSDWDRSEVEVALSQGEREGGNIKVKRVL